LGDSSGGDDGGLNQAKPQPVMVHLVSKWKEDCAVSGAGSSPAPLTANLTAWLLREGVSQFAHYPVVHYTF